MLELRLEKYINWMEDALLANFNQFQKTFKSVLPYNFSVDREKGTARFQMALAGYAADDLNVTYADGMLTISSNHKTAETDKTEFVHRGLSTRLFESVFPINPLYEIVDATLNHGLLIINFKKIKTTTKKVDIKTT